MSINDRKQNSRVRRRCSIGLSLMVSVVMVGCGAGSSDSGAGIRSAAESPGAIPTIGSIPLGVRTPIAQNGSYELPNVDFLTDIRLLDCPTAAADAMAVSATSDRVSTMTCNGGPVNAANFPSGGGTLTVDLNSGMPIRVLVGRALSLTTSNK